MGNFDRKYTDDQRDAMAHAYEDRKVRPARLVVELAQRGALEWKGQALDPFQTNDNTVRECAKVLRRKRQGKRTSQLSSLEPRDAIEALRLRLVNAADALLKDWEKEIAKPRGDADPERGRQIARLVREVAAMPGPKEPRKPAPGQHNPHTGTNEPGGRTAGLAGQIIHAARGETVRDAPTQQKDKGQSTQHEAQQSESAAAHDTAQAHDAAAAQPGSQASAHLLASSAS